jgi:hypothetical protein
LDWLQRGLGDWIVDEPVPADFGPVQFDPTAATANH